MRQILLDFDHVHDHSRISIAAPQSAKRKAHRQNYHDTGRGGSPGAEIVLCEGASAPRLRPSVPRICQRSAGLLASAAMNQVADPKRLLKHLRGELPAMLETLEHFVRCESPSTEKAAV